MGMPLSFSSKNTLNWGFHRDASVVDDVGVVYKGVVVMVVIDLVVVVMEVAGLVVVVVMDVRVEEAM